MLCNRCQKVWDLGGNGQPVALPARDATAPSVTCARCGEPVLPVLSARTVRRKILQLERFGLAGARPLLEPRQEPEEAPTRHHGETEPCAES
jgi:hypothetical protein